MRAVAWSAIVFAYAATAHAADRGAYLSASEGAFAGAGFEGLNVIAVGTNVTTGYRFGPVFALEGMFEGWFHTQPWQEPEAGAMCSGESTDQWHWQTFGARMWAHVVRRKHVDFAIALPWLAGGIAYDHQRSLFPPSAFCFSKPRDTAGALVVFGLIAFQLEIPLDDHFGLQLTTGVEIPLSLDAGLGVLAVKAAFGPAVHF